MFTQRQTASLKKQFDTLQRRLLQRQSQKLNKDLLSEQQMSPWSHNIFLYSHFIYFNYSIIVKFHLFSLIMHSI